MATISRLFRPNHFFKLRNFAYFHRSSWRAVSIVSTISVVAFRFPAWTWPFMRKALLHVRASAFRRLLVFCGTENIDLKTKKKIFLLLPLPLSHSDFNKNTFTYAITCRDGTPWLRMTMKLDIHHIFAVSSCSFCTMKDYCVLIFHNLHKILN